MTELVHFEDNGWDVRARLIDEQWVERAPRRREVAESLRREVSLLGWLAPQLPLRVPQPQVVAEDPLRLRHRLVPGSPCPGRSYDHGEQVGHFLSALHSVPVSGALDHGVPGADVTSRDRQQHRNDFASIVVPRLPVDLRPKALQLLVRLSQASYTVALVHADLGPDHVRVDGPVAGVIDWTDACLGDPALDLAWSLHGTSRAFADGVRSAYPVTGEIAARAFDWHLLGPWYEVRWGVQRELPDYVRSGLDGAATRLRA